MKKLLILSILAILPGFMKCYAQIPTSAYSFQAMSGTYTPVTNGTPTSAASTATMTGSILNDDGTQANVPIGFNFNFSGINFTTLSACSNGWISLSNSTSTDLGSGSVAGQGMLFPFWDDLHYGTTGFSTYSLTGSAPNRVFTLEWSGWGFCCTTPNVFSFEVKLFETSNVVQFVYSQNAPYSASAAIGIANSTSDYKVLSDAGPAPSTSSTTFNSSGITSLPATGQIYQFTPPVIPPCIPPTAQPTALTLASSASIVNGSFNGTTPAASGYLVVRSIGALSGAPVNGTVYSTGSPIGANGTVVQTGAATTFSDVALSPSTAYVYTIFSYSSGILCSTVFKVDNPLTSGITTGSTNIYTWNKNIAASYTVAANWTPARTLPDPTDILVFDNGISDTATNVPTQGIGRLSIANSTQAHLRSNSAATLSVNSNGVAGATALDISVGSGVVLDGPNAATNLRFGNGSVATIAGNLEVSNINTFTNGIDFTNAVTTIAPNGQLAAGGTNTANPFIIPSAAALVINGTYNHKYTTVAGTIPSPATWNTGSTVLITGYTTATAGPTSGTNQKFSNFVYNASNQTSVCNWSGDTLNVTGTFNVTSTGTGTFALASTQPYTATLNNFVQAGGTIDLATGTGVLPNTQIVSIAGTFNQLGGVIKSSGTTTTQPMLYFNGTTGTQSVTFSNAPTGPILYRVSNGGGINLLGINSLGSTPVFAINSGGGVRISTTAANPISTTLTLNYFATNTTLTYDTSGNLTATLPVWPSTSSPFNVTINVNTGNAVKVPFNATIPGTLTFQSGDIDMSSNNLTIGNSTLSTNQGTITEPTTGSPYLGVLGNGNVRITTGSLTRWFGTAALPTTATANTGITSAGYFPISFGPSNRNGFIYFSASNALATGGTITFSHNAATGTTAVSPVINDAGYSINTRTNASWTIATGNSLTLNAAVNGSFGLKATAGSLINPSNPAGLRLTRTGTTDPGANGGGGGTPPNFTASRTGLQSADLIGGPWYFAANTADINTGANGVYTQTTSGLWSVATNWDAGAVPGINNVAVINPGVNSYVMGAANAKALTVLGTLSDTVAAGILTVDSAMVNNGAVSVKNSGSVLLNTNPATYNPAVYAFVGIYNYGNFIINGGIVTIGPAGGGSKPFQNYGGFTIGPIVTSALNINGSFASLPGSYFTQVNGNITVDGNANGIFANSVPHGRAIFSLQTPSINMYGGGIKVVDPPTDPTLAFLSGPQTAFEYVVPAGTPVFNDSAAHTITFGDGISTDAGGNSRGFYINPQGTGGGLFNFSNLVVNGAPGINRAVTVTTALGVNRSLIINNGGEYRMSNRDLVLNGNLLVNAGGKLTTDDTGTLTFGKLVQAGTGIAVAPATPAVAPQTLSGTGVFVNANTSIANLGNIKVMSAPYVVFNTGGNITFPSKDLITFVPVNAVPSRIIMAVGNLAETGAQGASNNASAANGWVVGTYQKHVVPLNGLVGGNFNFPIGDSASYTPVNIAGTGTSVVAAGDIAISTKPGVAVTLPFSSFNPLKVLNRTYSISLSPGTVIAQAGLGVTFNWVPGDVSATANPQNFKVGINPSSTFWYYPGFTSASATSITEDTLVTGLYQVAEACPPTAIVTQPQPAGACVGGAPFTFSVLASGASLQYQWYHDNVAIAGANTATYTKQTPSITDGGTYFVVITGACAAPDTSNKVALVIGGAPPILTQPTSKSVCTGNSATLCVVASNALTYRWQRNGADLPIALQNSPCITIDNMSALDVGSYIVIVGNGCANDTSLAATLSILPLPSATITNSTPLAFCPGSNVLLTANSGVGFTYQWQHDGANIAGAVNQVYATTYAGNFGVMVTDIHNCSSTSATDSVTVFPAPFVQDSATGPTTFCIGGSVVIAANVNPTYTYHWQLNGINLPGTFSNSYTATAQGNYSLTVTGSNNCTSTTPAIFVQALAVPSGNIVASGSTALCGNTSVTLTAPTGSIFTWYNNNQPIIGQNNVSYQATAAGYYSVQVSNGYCSYTTPAVAVTQFPQPGLQIAASGPLAFCQGGSVVLSASAGTGVTYQWQQVTNGTAVNLSDTTDSFVTSAGGTYQLSLTNSGGCTAATNPVTVVVNPLPQPAVSANGAILSTTSSFTGYQWYRNGAPVPAGSGGTGASYTAPGSGVYTVFVSDGNGCTNMSAAFNYNAVEVGNVANSVHIKMYPNPAKDIVYIDAPVAVNVTVSSMDGKELFGQADAKSINIRELANGVYLVRISDAAGNLISVQKLVKAEN